MPKNAILLMTNQIIENNINSESTKNYVIFGGFLTVIF